MITTSARTFSVRTLVAALALLAAGCAPPDQGALDARRPDLAFGGPEGVGLSSEGLDRIRPAMQEMVDAGRTAGCLLYTSDAADE